MVDVDELGIPAFLQPDPTAHVIGAAEVLLQRHRRGDNVVDQSLAAHRHGADPLGGGWN
jgi:hypothetical protein